MKVIPKELLIILKSEILLSPLEQKSPNNLLTKYMDDTSKLESCSV